MSETGVQAVGGADELTGLADREAFDSALERALARAASAGEELTLIFLDLDHFRTFNETYGRQAGDEVLRRVAEALLSACPDSATVARFAGQAFAVLLPGCRSRDSFPVAARFRRAVVEGKGTARVTVSAGIASYPTHAHSAQGLVSAADEVMYASKSRGRDRSTRSTRGSFYRSNERRTALGKEPVPRPEDRPSARKTKKAERAPAAAASVKRARNRDAPWPLRVTAHPPPSSLATTNTSRNIEAELRQIILARLAS